MQGALVQTAALALLHFLWQGLLIGVLAAAILRSAAGRTAQQRHLICMAALVCCLLAPLITAAVVAPHVSEPQGLVRLRDAALAVSLQAFKPASSTVPGAFYATVLLWLAGALCVTAYYTTQWLGVWRVRRGAFLLEAPEHLAVCARDVLCRFRQTAHVLVMASHAVLAPVVIGVWRPVVVFPAALVARMSVKDFELILLHEAAHIVRRDTWANALQISLEILLFYHPAVHWLSRRARLERECACDDFAVGASGTRYEYARALTALALGPVAPVSLGATGGQLLQRLHHLAGERAAAESFHRSPAHLLLFAAVLSCVLLMRQPLTPQTISSLWSPTHAVQPTARAAARPRKSAPTERASRAPAPAPAALGQEEPQQVTPRTLAHPAASFRPAVTPMSPSSEPPGVPVATVNRNSSPGIPASPGTQAQELPAGGAPAAPAEIPRAQEPPAAAEVSLGPPAPGLTPIYDPAPEYPVQARLEGVQGSVLVLVRVGSDGRPTGLKIVRASPLGVFEGAVHRALMRWRFRVEDGQATERTAAYQLSFSLAGVSTAPASICATATASRTCESP